MSEIFKNILGGLSKDVKRYVELSDEIAEHIYNVLEQKGMTQKDLAKALDKRESEISKWLSGNHNFTLKSIAKIESALGCNLIFSNKKMNKINSNQITWTVSVQNVFSRSLDTDQETLDDYDDSDFSFIDEPEASLKYG